MEETRAQTEEWDNKDRAGGMSSAQLRAGRQETFCILLSAARQGG